MRIRFNSQLPTQFLNLNFSARRISPTGDVSDSPAVAAAMSPVANAAGLYEIDDAFAVGDYFVTIIDDTGNYQTSMFLRVFDADRYNLVDSMDNFGRESTAEETASAVEAELAEEFDALQPKRPGVI